MRRIFMAMIVGSVIAFGCGGMAKIALAGGVNITTVRAQGTDVYSHYFRAGEVVSIGVRGDGDTDLDLYVTSPSNRLVAQDDDDTDLCLIRFRAPEEGIYTIRVVNRGLVSNVYTIAVVD
jgi:hypothetical protein